MKIKLVIYTLFLLIIYSCSVKKLYELTYEEVLIVDGE
jgi:hypothetical protein